MVLINLETTIIVKANKTLKNKLSICTYNVRGYNSTKHSYIIELLSKCTILVIEEHWLNDQQLSNFGDLFPGYCVYGVTAMESSELLHGRPKGGVLVIYPDSFSRNTKVIQTHFERLCVLNLHINDMSLYLFCLYMPIDNNKTENLNEYDNILTEISMICTQNNAEYMCSILTKGVAKIKN